MKGKHRKEMGGRHIIEQKQEKRKEDGHEGMV